MAFGFPPRHEEETFLEKYTTQQFLVLGIESANKLDWNISLVTEKGFIAYLNKGHLKWNAKIQFEIEGNSATITSESIGYEVIDWGKNSKTIETFIETLIDLKHQLKTDELNQKYEELKPNLNLPEQPLLNQSTQTNVGKLNEFFSFFIPRQGYFITPILIDINIFIYILIVSSGVNFFLPESESLLNWGANFKPLTMGGEWWRLITNCFIHIGILHLLMNMYALLYVGLLLEPQIGKVRFISAYLITGITASITSLFWHDLTISAGASGAIFGLYGVFLALLSTNLIEKNSRKALLTSIGVFVGYNLLYGMKGGIDNAAHIGGLIGGLVIGFSFYPSLVKPELKTRNIIINSLTLLGILGISFFVIFQTPNPIGKYDKLMTKFGEIEQKALSFYRVAPYSMGDKYLKTIKDEGLPNWKECRNLINTIDSIENLPDELKSKISLLKKYCDYRITSFELLAETFELNTTVYNNQINLYNQKIELIIKKLKGEEIADSLLIINPIRDFASNLPKGVLYVIDGKPVDDIKEIKPEEIKSVVFVAPEKSFQIYGEMGKDGALWIRTKK